MYLTRLLIQGILMCSIVLHCEPSSAAGKHGSAEGNAPLFSDLGNLNHPITTKSERAQRYFDQGLTFSYGFNHDEAIRSFKAAAAIDPDCAMAYWGIALCMGPNINMPMDPATAPEAYAQLQKAIALKDKVSKKEQAYIDALATRYEATAPADRAPLDHAYANAMRGVYEAYPDDLDAAALYVESLLDLRPWNYWTRDGEPLPGTEKIVTLLEAILVKDPNHFGACHFYIHAVEASKTPERAEAAADRLLTLVPAAGHLVHMPSHAYIRIGRYHDASSANQKADEADDSYITQCNNQGAYPLLYHPHNTHFLAATAAMEGRANVAIDAARKTNTLTVHGPADAPGMEAIQHFLITPAFALVRFAKWDEVMREASPPADRPYMAALWRYSRTIATARMGHLADAERELGALREVIKTHDLSKAMISATNTAASVLEVALAVAEAEVELARGNTDAGIAHYQRAVEKEDALNYTEPPDWYTPTRHGLGAVLLDAGKTSEAEAVYRADLERNVKNGWGYFGLAQALRAQGKMEEAAKIDELFKESWKHADITLTSTRL